MRVVGRRGGGKWAQSVTVEEFRGAKGSRWGGGKWEQSVRVEVAI